MTEKVEQQQAAALEAAGVPAQATHTEDLPRTQRRNPSAEALVARALALKQCRKGDRLVVAELPVVAVSTPDLIAVLRTLGEKGAALLDASDGTEYRWHPQANSLADAVAKFDQVLREARTRNAREVLHEVRTKRGVRVGRLPALTPAQKAEAKIDWNTPGMSVTEIAAKWGVSRPTLHSYFGPRFSAPPTPRRQRRKK